MTRRAAAPCTARRSRIVWFGVDFLRYGETNVPNLAKTLVDPLLEIVRNGAVGRNGGRCVGKSGKA
jgi:hypothetical protein